MTMIHHHGTKAVEHNMTGLGQYWFHYLAEDGDKGGDWEKQGSAFDFPDFLPEDSPP